MKIWDAHNHWMPPEVARHTAFFQKGWSDIGLLLKTLDQAGIEKTVLLYPTSDAHLNMGGWSGLSRIYNQELAKKIRQHPDRLIGAGILSVDKLEEVPSELARIKDQGLSCLSLASSYDGKYLEEQILLPLLEQAQAANLPIFVHAQIINPIGYERVKDPLLMPVVEYLFDITMCAGGMMMSGIFNRFSNLKVIFAHFAGVLPFLADRFNSTYAMLRSREIVRDLGQAPSEILKNILVDTSGVSSAAMLNMALEFFGPERILWGSDFPVKRNPGESINAVKTLNIREEEKQNILSGNLITLFEKGE